MANNDDISGRDHPAPKASPISGITNATDAGATLMRVAKRIKFGRLRKKVRFELVAYMGVMSSWFLGLGLQMVLFAYLITEKLELDATELGAANMALAGPAFIFLLLGGVVAERADGRRLLMILHVLAGIPPLFLVYALHTNTLSLLWMVTYGVVIGTIGAFLMPARDSIISQVVDRRQRIGSRVTLQLGVTLATMAQFLAQIVGLILAGYADKATTMPVWLGGFSLGPIPTEKLLWIQSIGLILGAVFAAFMARGRKVVTGRTGLGAAWGDIAEGYRAVRNNDILWAMTVLMLGIGFFVIGAFLVVLPILNRDLYGLGPDGLRDMFVTFWMGAFVASVGLTIRKNIVRPGRLLLMANFFGAAIILIMIMRPPHAAFLAVVFLWGMAGGVSISMSRSIVQGASQKDQLARVMSIYQLGSMAGAPFGAVIMGYLTDAFGANPERVAVVVAFGMFSVILWIGTQTPIWNMRDPALNKG